MVQYIEKEFLRNSTTEERSNNNSSASAEAQSHYSALEKAVNIHVMHSGGFPKLMDDLSFVLPGESVLPCAVSDGSISCKHTSALA